MKITASALKKELKKLGIKTYKHKATGESFVKKGDVKKVLTKVSAMVPSSGKGHKLETSETMEYFTDEGHSTYAPDTYYFSFDKLPEDIQEKFMELEVEIDKSRYTVQEPTAYLRAKVTTSDGGVLDVEYHLGKVGEDDDYDEDGNLVLEDEYAEWKSRGEDIASVSDFSQDVSFEINDYGDNA